MVRTVTIAEVHPAPQPGSNEGEPPMRRLWYLFTLLPVLGLVLTAVGPSAGASTAAHASKQARAAAAAHAYLAHLKIGRPLPNQLVPGQHPSRVRGLSQFNSFNWSGYADDNTSGNTYSKVTGKWTEPAITCGTEDQIAVFWVGIDGWS